MLWIERLPALDGWDLWAVCERGRETLNAPSFPQWRAAAERHLAGRPELAAYSISSPTSVTFLSGRVADLIGISPQMHQTVCTASQLQEWMAAITRKGLLHHIGMPDSQESVHTITVGIDAVWLGGGSESGAQVAATELVRGLASRAQIERVMLISESGGVPAGLQGIGKVSGAKWSEVLAAATPAVDILHRPYQPAGDVDYRRYQRVARCVALTVLDFIAYDNRNYHESERSWRQHQQVFEENVCLADCLFAISRSVGTRLEQQFPHQLEGPVRVAPLGTDHLHSITASGVAPELGPAVRALEHEQFVLVLGNDFEHKNRDFAVKVFAEMRDRGYEGKLVLAGFHLDLGSSFAHELLGANAHRAHVIRFGPVSRTEKTWLLERAQAVLYPTSAEGFGLVPFEAAALGTPTAFVKFGPLAEMLPNVDACDGWQIRAFADLVLRLLADPAPQVAQIRDAAAKLTWSAHVDQILAGYEQLMRPGAPWRTRRVALPGWRTRLARAADAYRHRALNKIRRLTGRTS